MMSRARRAASDSQLRDYLRRGLCHYCAAYRRITTAFREAPPCYTKPRTYFEVVALIVNIRP